MVRKLLLALAGAAAGAFMVFGTAQAAPAASGSLAALKTRGIEHVAALRDLLFAEHALQMQHHARDS